MISSVSISDKDFFYHISRDFLNSFVENSYSRLKSDLNTQLSHSTDREITVSIQRTLSSSQSINFSLSRSLTPGSHSFFRALLPSLQIFQLIFSSIFPHRLFCNICHCFCFHLRISLAVIREVMIDLQLQMVKPSF